MYDDLGPRQREILEYIGQAMRTRGYPPSVREIGLAVGLSSTSTVHAHLAKLEAKGYIRRDPTKPRAIELLDDESRGFFTDLVPVPLVGSITAGEPILAVENIEETYPLPAGLIGAGPVFMLRVKGISMINAGIMDGDFVLVRQQNTANNGEIVVALLEDEATVKRFYKENGHYRLQPENDYLEPIIAQQVEILGKVTGVFRKL